MNNASLHISGSIPYYLHWKIRIILF